MTSRPSSPTKSVRVKSSVSTSLRKSQSQSSTPTKPSPTDHGPPARRSRLSPPTARVTTRPQTPKSTPATPEPSRLRSLTNTGPVPLHHALSFSSLQPSSKPADATIRVTSKVSGAAQSVHASNANDASPILSASRPPQATLVTRHTRAGSASSNIASPPTFYPITTASPAANPYRYAPPRPSVHNLASPFVPAVKTDFSTPPPPLSPPVSISSHSSVSYSSTVSHNADAYNRQDSSSSPEHSPTGLSRVSPLNTHRHHDSSSDSHDYDDSDEHNVKAAAKSNRKIADLEITNRSLMLINASLEAAKHKQAKEISDLRRKLRETRLILPPRAFITVQSSQDIDHMADGDGDEDDEDEDEGGAETDEAFLRVTAMLENLIESGKRALEAKVADYGGAGSAAKVLSAEEVRSWRRNSVEGEDSFPLPPLSPSRVAVPDSSDDDETPLDIDQSTINPSSPPPIFVIPSP